MQETLQQLVQANQLVHSQLQELHEKHLQLQGQLQQQAAGPPIHGVPIIGNNARVNYRGLAREEVENFITDMNHQFIFTNHDDKMQGLVAGAALSEEAARWYARLPIVRQKMPPGWLELQKLMRKRFAKPNIEWELYRKLTHCRQKNQSVRAYSEEYQTLLTQIESYVADLGDWPKLFYYVEGLQATVRNSVRINKPQTLEEAIDLALTQGDEHGRDQLQYKPNRSTNQRSGTQHMEVGSSSARSKHTKRGKSQIVSQIQRRPVSKEGEDDEEDDTSVGSRVDNLFLEPAAVEAEMLARKPLSSMKVKGKLNGSKTTFIIDTGAEVNVMSRSFAESAKLKPLPCAETIRNFEGTSAPEVKVVHEISVTLGKNFYARESFRVIPRTTEDVILGLPFLTRHNAKIDFVDRTVELNLAGTGVIQLRCHQPTNNTELTKLDTARVASTLLTAKQADREALQNENVMLVYIRSVADTTHLDRVDIPLERAGILIEPLRLAYQDIFPSKLVGLPPNRAVEADLDTTEDKPIYKAPYRLSPRERGELKRQITELLAAGFIRPSTSEWGAPVLFVKKKTGELRLCVDYRGLNKVTRRARYPLPKIDEIFDQLKEGRVFSRLDLKSGYHQMRIAPKDVHKTAFVSDSGHYEWLVAPFGLTNLPSQWTRLMTTIFQPLIGKNVVVYLDDILIYSESCEQHAQDIKEVFDLLRKHKLYLHPTKCAFFLKRVAYLGFVIEKGTLTIDPGKIDAIAKIDNPRTVPQCRAILGMTNYFRRFIRDYGKILAPLNRLLKKNVDFELTNECDTALKAIKHAICSAPVLAIPDLNVLEFTLTTDASGVGLGGVLAQNGHPVAYASRAFNETEQRYATHEREMFAIVYCFNLWRHYLEGAKTIVYTDHNNLRYFNDSFNLSRRMTRYWEKMAGFDYEIRYLPGRANVVADLLSRDPLVNVKLVTTDDVTRYAESKTFRTHHTAAERRLLQHETRRCSFDSDLGQVVHREEGGNKTLWVPFEMRADLIEDIHKALGHPGREETLRQVRKRGWWPTLAKDARRMVQTCPKCQIHQNQDDARRNAPQHPLPTVPIFSRWHLDFIGRLPTTTNKNKWILVAVDSLSRWPVAKATKDATAETTARFIYEEIVVQYGAPVEILTDRGANFRAEVVVEYLKMLPTKQTFTSAYHPRTNATAERWNRTFQNVLTKYVGGAIRQWDRFLHQALFACRVRTHRTAKMSPFQIIYGLDPRLPGVDTAPFLFTPEERDLRAEMRADDLRRMARQRDAVRVSTEASKEAAKRAYDGEVARNELNIGTWVGVKNWTKTKLQYKHFGPYMVVQKRAFDTYRLEDPDGKRMPVLFHRDRLNPVHVTEGRPSWWYKPTGEAHRELNGETEVRPDDHQIGTTTVVVGGACCEMLF